MSVINKMLKDLDERGQLKPPIADDTHGHNHGNQADAALVSAVNVNHQALAKAYGAQLASAQAKKPWSLIVLGTVALVLMLGAAWMGMRLPGLMQGTPQSAAPESLASSESLPAADIQQASSQPTYAAQMAPITAPTAAPKELAPAEATATVAAANTLARPSAPNSDGANIQPLTQLQTGSVNPVAATAMAAVPIQAVSTQAVVTRTEPEHSAQESIGSDDSYADNGNNIVTLSEDESMAHNDEFSGSEASDSAEASVNTEASESAVAHETSIATVPAKPARYEPVTITTVTKAPARMAGTYMDKAYAANQMNDVPAAINAYRQALVLDPSLVPARIQLAVLEFGQGRLVPAQQVLNEGLRLTPTNSDLLMLLARIEHANGQVIQALSTVAKIPDVSAMALQKWIQLGDWAQNAKQFEQAEQAYRQLVGIEPDVGRWWLGLAYAMDAQARYQDAAQAYRNALQAPGLSASARNYIENRLSQLGGSL